MSKNYYLSRFNFLGSTSILSLAGLGQLLIRKTNLACRKLEVAKHLTLPFLWDLLWNPNRHFSTRKRSLFSYIWRMFVRFKLWSGKTVSELLQIFLQLFIAVSKNKIESFHFFQTCFCWFSKLQWKLNYIISVQGLGTLTDFLTFEFLPPKRTCLSRILSHYTCVPKDKFESLSDNKVCQPFSSIQDNHRKPYTNWIEFSLE